MIIFFLLKTNNECLCFFQIIKLQYSTKSSSKICNSALEAITDIKDGSKLLVGGFGLCGIPENLIAAMLVHGAKDLTVVSNNAGMKCYINYLIFINTFILNSSY